MSSRDNFFVEINGKKFPLSKSSMDNVIDKLTLDMNFHIFAYFTSINAHGDDVEFGLDEVNETISRSDAISILTTILHDAMDIVA